MKIVANLIKTTEKTRQLRLDRVDTMKNKFEFEMLIRDELRQIDKQIKELEKKE